MILVNQRPGLHNMSLTETKSHSEYCQSMLDTMTVLCRDLKSVSWVDDWEYLVWAYLAGDIQLPSNDKLTSAAPVIIDHLRLLKQSAEKVNGWVNDVTFFEMERWLVLYRNWKSRYPELLQAN